MKSHSNFSPVFWGIATELCPSLAKDPQWERIIDTLYAEYGGKTLLDAIAILQERKGVELPLVSVDVTSSYLKGILRNKKEEHKIELLKEQKLNPTNCSIWL